MRGDTDQDTVCVCDAESECCDGCYAVNVGSSCDDGFVCQAGSSCQPDGRCADGEFIICPSPSPTAPNVDCLAFECREPDGCNTEAFPTNEGGTCSLPGDDERAATCRNGVCTADCTCSVEDECCDGCHPINAGLACDDGLDCTLDTTCQNDGTCGGSTGSPCDAQLEHPDCQAAMCDEVAGCSTTNMREGFECSTPLPGTFDGICQAGVCVGQQQCECSADDGPCCDGCHIQPAGHVCDTAGATIGCDGECGGEIVTNRISFVCDGTTLECGTDPRLIEESRVPCAATELCVQGDSPQNTKCESSPMCE